MRQNLCCLVVFLRITLFLCSFRVQYARWKEECRQLFPLVGSGRFITAPVVSEEGQRIQDPLVLSETNVENGISDQNAMVDSRTNASSELGVVKDKKVIQWMLTLHQIGRCHLLFQCNFSFCLERFTRQVPGLGCDSRFTKKRIWLSWQVLMWFALIGHWCFMRSKITQQNFGTFQLYMPGSIQMSAIAKVGCFYTTKD